MLCNEIRIYALKYHKFRVFLERARTIDLETLLQKYTIAIQTFYQLNKKCASLALRINI